MDFYSLTVTWKDFLHGLLCCSKVAKAMVDSDMGIDVDEYVDQLRPGLMEVVAAWCNGAKFADILKLSDGIFEVGGEGPPWPGLSCRVTDRTEWKQGVTELAGEMQCSSGAERWG